MAKRLRVGVKRSFSIRPIHLLEDREAAGVSQEDLSLQIPSLGTQQNISLIEGQLLHHQITPKVIAEAKAAGFKVEFYDI